LLLDLTTNYRDPEGVKPPSVEVTKLEGTIENGLVKLPQTATFPNRPGYGTQGRQIVLFANYMQLISESKNDLYRYDTAIGNAPNGNPPSAKKCKHIIRLLLEEFFEEQLEDLATDYRSTLISREPLGLELKEFQVRWKAEGEDSYSDDPITYTVTVKYTGTVSVSDLVDYLTSSNASRVLDNKPTIIQALNIIVGHGPKSDLGVGTVGANKHFSLSPAANDRASLGGGLEVIRGFFISVRAATARILVNLQVKNLACYEPGPLQPLMNSCGLRHRSLERFLKTLRIELTHLIRKTKNNETRRRVKSIWGFATQADGRGENRPQVKGFGAGPNDVKFWLSESGPGSVPSDKSKRRKDKREGPATPGKYITVADYFKTREL
jgi:hypothetical protein